MEKPPSEDASPIKSGVFLIAMLVFVAVYHFEDFPVMIWGAGGIPLAPKNCSSSTDMACWMIG